jgi:hypothetical protein
MRNPIANGSVWYDDKSKLIYPAYLAYFPCSRMKKIDLQYHIFLCFNVLFPLELLRYFIYLTNEPG